MKNNITLITGASGFIGRNLIPFLKGRGREVHALVRIQDGTLTCRQFLGDIAKSNPLENVTPGIDTIIHLASISNATRRDLENINVRGTHNLLEAAQKKGVRKIIYASSENVFLNLPDAYTQTKKRAEEMIKGFGEYAIIRPSPVYGKGENASFQRLLSAIKKWPIIPIIGTGKNKLQPIYIDDLLHCIFEVLKNDLKGIYTISGGEAVTLETLIDIMMKHLDIRKRKVFIPIAVLYPFVAAYQRICPSSVMNVEKLKSFTIDRVSDRFTLENEKLFQIKFLKPDEGMRRYICGLNE